MSQVNGPNLSDFYKIIRGNDILTVMDDTICPIVEGILYPSDYIMLVAEEKMGKTIISQQLSCCLTTGRPFLNTFDIPKAVKVWYFITEGKENDIKDRFLRMKNGIDFNPDNLTLIPTFFRFNTMEGIKILSDIVSKNKEHRPDVVIIDSLYAAIKGKLRDEEVANDFTYAVRMLQKDLNCAIIIVHHFTKRIRTPDGKVIERTDKDLFGSTFLAAAVDHVIWLDRWMYGHMEEKGNDKILKCDTQRSGKIFDSIRIRLEEPDPLYFIPVDKRLEEKHRVKEILKSSKDFISSKEIMNKARVGRTVLFGILRNLEDEKVLLKNGDRKHMKYWIKK